MDYNYPQCIQISWFIIHKVGPPQFGVVNFYGSSESLLFFGNDAVTFFVSYSNLYSGNVISFDRDDVCYNAYKNEWCWSFAWKNVRSRLTRRSTEFSRYGYIINVRFFCCVQYNGPVNSGIVKKIKSILLLDSSTTK